MSMSAVLSVPMVVAQRPTTGPGRDECRRASSSCRELMRGISYVLMAGLFRAEPASPALPGRQTARRGRRPAHMRPQPTATAAGRHHSARIAEPADRHGGDAPVPAPTPYSREGRRLAARRQAGMFAPQKRFRLFAACRHPGRGAPVAPPASFRETPSAKAACARAGDFPPATAGASAG